MYYPLLETFASFNFSIVNTMCTVNIINGNCLQEYKQKIIIELFMDFFFNTLSKHFLNNVFRKGF